MKENMLKKIILSLVFLLAIGESVRTESDSNYLEISEVSDESISRHYIFAQIAEITRDDTGLLARDYCDYSVEELWGLLQETEDDRSVFEEMLTVE
jgi:hypothetical protein